MGKRSTEIGNELMRLFDQQTEFLGKTAPTPEELREYEQWRERTRELFAELEAVGKGGLSVLPNRAWANRLRHRYAVQQSCCSGMR